MEKQYNELYSIKLSELDALFSTPAKKRIGTMNITTLGELFELSEKKEFITYFVDIYTDSYSAVSPLYQEIIGTVKLLKYKYLGIDPKFSKESRLNELGFSTKACHGIIRYKKYIPFKEEEVKKFYEEYDLMELITLLSDKTVLVSEFSQTYSVGIKVVDEVREKMEILNLYFGSKKIIEHDNSQTRNDDISNDDLQQLYKQLEDLLHQHQTLSEQILILQKKISEKINMEAMDGTNRKK